MRVTLRWKLSGRLKYPPNFGSFQPGIRSDLDRLSPPMAGSLCPFPISPSAISPRSVGRRGRVHDRVGTWVGFARNAALWSGSTTDIWPPSFLQPVSFPLVLLLSSATTHPPLLSPAGRRRHLFQVGLLRRQAQPFCVHCIGEEVHHQLGSGKTEGREDSRRVLRVPIDSSSPQEPARSSAEEPPWNND